MVLRGCFRILLLYDVAEAINLKTLRDLLGPHVGQVRHEFPRRTPEYVRFENPPVIERIDPITLSTGEELSCSLKYYSYAVVVAQFEFPFECDWASLLSQTSGWIDQPEVESRARELVRQSLERIAPAITRPTAQWLQESYLIINMQEVRDNQNNEPAGSDMIWLHTLRR